MVIFVSGFIIIFLHQNLVISVEHLPHNFLDTDATNCEVENMRKVELRTGWVGPTKLDLGFECCNELDEVEI